LKPLYVIHFTLFKGGSALSKYIFFETKKELDDFIFFHPLIGDNCIIFKNIDLLEVEDENNKSNRFTYDDSK